MLNDENSMAVLITKSHLENLPLLNVTLNIVAKKGKISHLNNAFNQSQY